MNKYEREALRPIAERLIGSYILAIEHDDISGFDNWVTNEDHWYHDCSDGERILDLLGFEQHEIEQMVDDIRFSLLEEEDLDLENEDDYEDQLTSVREEE